MRSFLRATACMLTICSSATVAQGETTPVVVELYTSQGCSSCPPADAMLAEMSQFDHVIPLALHVDYWDYIGWKDDFANPAHTRRQQDYARAAGATTIYTPQFVVAGQDVVVGAKAMKLSDKIQAHSQVDLAVSLDLGRDGEQISIEAAWDAGTEPQPTVVQLVRVKEEETVDIRRGENAGHQLTYSNIVQSWDVLEDWDGASPLSLTVDVAQADFVVVIVQAGTNGPILGAAKIN